MPDLLKPQDKVRIRCREEGSEPDRDVAAMLLLDLSGSLKEKAGWSTRMGAAMRHAAH